MPDDVLGAKPWAGIEGGGPVGAVGEEITPPSNPSRPFRLGPGTRSARCIEPTGRSPP